MINKYEAKVTMVINNIKNHCYSVADYKLCEEESKVVIAALEHYLDEIKGINGGYRVTDV